MIENKYLGSDVFINHEISDIEFGTNNDFKLQKSNNNLIQAIVSRLKTYQSELKLHEQYGSKLNDIIGEVSDSLILIRINKIVRAALLQEPRIQDSGILRIDPVFRQNTNRQVVDIYIQVLPINDQQPLNMVFPFILED
jgi:phage baseplate assembly protein W